MALTAKEKAAKILRSPPPKRSQFDSDATMIADVSTLNKQELDSINLDTPSVPSKNIDDDDIFDDNFDLNAAINELTQDTNDVKEDVIITEKKNKAAEGKQPTAPENNHGDVFNTDAYDTTNASSVSDILSEMEGQLSLDIADPKKDKLNKTYDANNEFDFLNIENKKPAKEELVDKFDFLDEDDDIENNDDSQEEHFEINEPEFDDDIF